LAIAVALGRAAQRRILVKGGDVLQLLDRPGTIWLDKTGTLTQGKLRLVEWFGDERCKPAVAAIEQASSHPLAVAIHQGLLHEVSLTADPLERLSASEVTQTAEGGIRGRVDGQQILVGNQSFLAQHDISIPGQFQSAAAGMIEECLTPVFVAVDRQVAAVASIGDVLRSDARQAVRALRRAGWQVGILSGDHERIVKQIGAQLEIAPQQCLGGMLPEDKVTVVERSATAGTVVMVGDGVNDSAALAAATVGVATHNGAEASLQAAQVYLGEPGLAGVLQLIDAGRSTMKTIRRNFAASLAYNAIGVGLAAVGWINPLAAALLMPLSSLTVVSLSLSARTFSEKQPQP
jgi:Cu2+-exporting ATPase